MQTAIFVSKYLLRISTMLHKARRMQMMQMKLQAVARLRSGKRHYFLRSEDSKIEKQMLTREK